MKRFLWVFGAILILAILSDGRSFAHLPFRKVVCKDNLTSTGFSVTYSSTTNVSGGGTALNTAVAGVGSSTRLLITDSETYDPVAVSGCTDLTIEADAGQQPVIRRASPSHTTGGWCLSLQGSIDGFAIRGVIFSGNGNRNSLSYKDDGLLDLRDDSASACTFADRIIVDNCDFAEDGTDNTNSCCGLFFVGYDGSQHKRVQVIGCTFTNNSNGSQATSNGYGTCSVIGFDTVYFQNCSAIRTDAVVARASSHMRGFIFNNNATTVEDCLSHDLGTAGSNEGFKHVASFGSDIAAGPSTLRNCVAYRCKRGYREDHPSQSMTITNSVYHTDLTGILDKAVRLDNTGTSLTITDSVLVGAGDGICFNNAAITENHNDVYTFGTIGLTLAGTDLTVDPKFLNVAAKEWVAKASSVKTGASDSGAMGVRYPGGTAIIWCGH